MLVIFILCFIYQFHCYSLSSFYWNCSVMLFVSLITDVFNQVFIQSFLLLSITITLILISVMLYVIQYHLYNFKNVKNTHGEVSLLVKFAGSACNFTKSTTSPRVFFTFLNCTNGTKLRKAFYVHAIVLSSARSSMNYFKRRKESCTGRKWGQENPSRI